MKQWIKETLEALELYKKNKWAMTYVLPVPKGELCSICRLPINKRAGIIHELYETGAEEMFCSEECWFVKDKITRTRIW